MKPLGIALVVIGIVALLYGGVSWTHKDKVIDAGPIQVTADKHERIPIPPVAGGILLVLGAVLLVKGGR